MIKARKFVPSLDYKEADRLTNENKGKDIRLDRDIIGVVEEKFNTFKDGSLDPVNPVRLSGLCVGRPVIFVHGFFIDRASHSVTTRLIAEHLLGWAFGFLSHFGVLEILFIVDRSNKSMQDFMVEHGAKQQHDGLIYSLRLDGDQSLNKGG